MILSTFDFGAFLISGFGFQNFYHVRGLVRGSGFVTYYFLCLCVWVRGAVWKSVALSWCWCGVIVGVIFSNFESVPEKFSQNKKKNVWEKLVSGVIKAAPTFDLRRPIMTCIVLRVDGRSKCRRRRRWRRHAAGLSPESRGSGCMSSLLISVGPSPEAIGIDDDPKASGRWPEQAQTTMSVSLSMATTIPI